MYYRRLFLPMILFIFVFVGFACGSTEQARTPTETQIVIAITESSTSTAPFQTITPTPVPTWTLIPRLSPGEARGYIENLLKENADCQLPCWWGVIPGQTRWQTAEALLARFADSVYESSGESSNRRYIEMLFPAPYPSTENFRQVYLVEHGIVQRIEVLPQHFSKYSLPQGLLEEVGHPESIFLGGSVNQPQSFQLILYYPSQGIFALYSNELHPFQQQQVLNLCFTEAEIAYVDIFLWDPADSFSETLDYVFGEYERTFYEIEIVTNLTIDEFSDLFESGKISCFQTPSGFWTN